MEVIRSWVLSAAACVALVGLVAQPALAETVKGKVEAVGNEGREVTVKTADGKMFKAAISGSRTSVMIGGQKADRGALKAGQECTVEAPKDGGEATKVDCK